MSRARRTDAALWAHHHTEFRDPMQVVAQWQPASVLDHRLLEHRVRGRFWEALEQGGSTLVVTREYEHLVVALAVVSGRPRLSYLRLPHPSGLAVDTAHGVLHVASTRNPNVVFDFAPATAALTRNGEAAPKGPPAPLVPAGARYLPGCLYLHDLAMVGSRLLANAVALNAVVELPPRGGFRPVWWPRSIDAPGGPRTERNYLQLNSIASGGSLRRSFFSASAAAPSARRPGQLHFPVDKRGVIFSGRTRDVVATGLTRPHSARLFDGELWVDNSGYGEVGRIVAGRFEPVLRLPGWTRGLASAGGIAFVGTSRVIPRFRHYAPGLDAERSETAVHAVDLAHGRVLGSLTWARGNQIFAIEPLGGLSSCGFPYAPGERLERWRHHVYFAGSPASQPR